jgi:SAM-dependent methyltransferase
MNAVQTVRQLALPQAAHMRCPACKKDMGELAFADATARVRCDLCGFEIGSRDGIWRALPPCRELYFRRFVAEYAAIRQREGRGSDSAEYYLALPFRDLSGRNAWQWKIRASSFRCLERNVLPELEAKSRGSLSVLDIGAGNGWLSYRLALRGHDCIAVDLLDNGSDGLGAARHYRSSVRWPITTVQAEMDHLPFSDQQFDLVVFNAAFHYSENYARTLSEAVRCLRPGGCVAILDTPWYERDESGRAMVLEKYASFEKQHGTRSDSIASLEYLTPDRLRGLERVCGLQWKSAEAWYGWKWALRPWQATLQGRRVPSKFRLFWATVGSA